MVPRTMLVQEWTQRGGDTNTITRAIGDLVDEKRIEEVPLGRHNAKGYSLPAERDD